MVEEERASTSSELRHPAEGEVDDEHVATTSGTGDTVEAESELRDGLENIVVPMDRVAPVEEIEEAGGSASAKVRWAEKAGPDGSTLAGGSGASAGVQAGESKDSKAESDGLSRSKAKVEVAHEVINVEVGGGETRRYSIDEFGKILQTSQWSLRHRIEVCRVLECNGWLMTPLSRQEYAKQSLALVERSHAINMNDISVSDCPSLEEMSLLVKEELDNELDKDSSYFTDAECKKLKQSIWREHLSKLRNYVMEHVFGDWKELRNLLEEELESLREKDKLEEWYKRAFEGRGTNLQPWEIYAAMEKGLVYKVQMMMAKIGEEQWGKLKPREYCGATPLHWAALHSCVDKRLWDVIDSNPWPEELSDDFGFKPVHMAIFASSFFPANYEWIEDISQCLKMIDGYAAILTGDPQLDLKKGEKLLDIVTWNLHHKKPTYGWNFVVCPLTRSARDGSWVDSYGATDKRIHSANTKDTRSGYGDINIAKFLVFKLVEEKPGKQRGIIEYTFVAKCYFDTPIHPLHLAMWIGHPSVVEKLIRSFKGMRHFSLLTDNGDTVLHLAFKAMDFEPQFTNNKRDIESEGRIRGEFRPRGEDPIQSEDRIWSEDYMAKGMNYVSREQVMTIMMRYLHSYPHMLNSQNKDGQTPLHIAIFQGNISCVRALLRCDYADYNKKNVKGVTPIDVVLRLKEEDSIPHRMYASILGRKCTCSEEAGFTTIKCNDVWYFNYHGGRTIDDLVEKLDFHIVRLRRILQLSQWSYRHRIYALQMIDENPTVGLESVKDTYIKQCDFRLTEHRDNRLANDDVEQSVENAEKCEKLKLRFIKEISRRYGERLFAHEQAIFAAIEGGDKYEFERLFKKEILLRGNLSYKGANPLHWALLHGELGIMSLICKSLAYIRPRFASQGVNSRTKIVDVPDGFGFTYVHFASIYSFIRLDAKYKPIMQSNERFTVEYSSGDVRTHYQMMVNELRDTGLWRGLNHGLWRDDRGDFVVWGITSTDVICVDNYLTQTLLSPLHMAVVEPHGLEILLKDTPQEAWAESNVKTGDTILHNAQTWEALTRIRSKDKWSKIWPTLYKQLHDQEAVNSRNLNRETPLHRAVHTKSLQWVAFLVQFEHLQFNVRDKEMLTPGDCAAKMLRDTPSDTKVKKIVEILDSYDPETLPRKKEIEQAIQRDEDKKRMIKEGFQRDRQVYVDAANAILVGGALIASASFGAWLQPPLGLQPYYSPEFLDTSAPPASGPNYDSYVAIQQHWTIQMFWIFNSLSFFFSLATVIAGADAALPSPGLDVEPALNSVKRAVKLEAWLLIASILFVICTFATVGFTILPPISKYRVNMICTLVIGVVLCFLVLIKLLRKLFS